MKILITLVCALSFTACGAQVATTAATGAAIKKQEIEAGKQTKDMVDKKIGEAAQAMQKRDAQQGEAGK